MATPNPACPSFIQWPGVAKRRQALEEQKPRPFVPPKSCPYIPAEWQKAADLPDEEVPSASATALAAGVAASITPASAQPGGSRSFSPNDLGAAIEAVKSNRTQDWLQATKALRKALSTENQRALQEGIAAIIGGDVMPTLVVFMQRSGEPELQLEAAWALTNVASGNSEQCAQVVKAGALPHMAPLLTAGSADLREQAAWLVGNVAGDGAALRDQVLDAGLLPPLLQVLQDKSSPIKVSRITVWAISNIFRAKPFPDRSHMPAALDALAAVLPHLRNDQEFTVDAVWAASYMAEAQEETVADSPVLPLLLDIFASTPPSETQLLTPLLRLVGNLSSGSDKATQRVVDAGVLAGGIKRILQEAKSPKLLKEAAWTVSNITAGTLAQAHAVESAGLLPLLVRHLQSSPVEVSREAAWALANPLDKSTAEPTDDTPPVAFAAHAVEAGAIPAFKAFLESTCGSSDNATAKAQVEAVKGLMAIAKYGAELALQQHGRAGSNAYVDLFAEAGLYEVLRQLKESGGNVAHSAEQLLTRHPDPTASSP